jgi:hypothetical protein
MDALRADCSIFSTKASFASLSFPSEMVFRAGCRSPGQPIFHPEASVERFQALHNARLRLKTIN